MNRRCEARWANAWGRAVPVGRSRVAVDPVAKVDLVAPDPACRDRWDEWVQVDRAVPADSPDQDPACKGRWGKVVVAVRAASADRARQVVNVNRWAPAVRVDRAAIREWARGAGAAGSRVARDSCRKADRMGRVRMAHRT